MKKARGFRLGRKLVKILKSAINRKTTKQYRRLTPPSSTTNTISRLCNWARGLCLPKSKSGYVRVGHGPIEAAKPGGVPKGHLAVYVGEKEEDAHRYLVPVIYFNHPLFGDLLKEVENEYGYDHPGRIQIPCRVSERTSGQELPVVVAATAIGCGGCGVCRAYEECSNGLQFCKSGYLQFTCREKLFHGAFCEYLFTKVNHVRPSYRDNPDLNRIFPG